MRAIRKILVIVDPTAPVPQVAVDKAAVFARHYGADIELLECQRQSQCEAEDPSDHGSPLLEELGTRLLAGGIKVERNVIRGALLHEALLTHIKACHADWVVKGTHPHRLSSRVLARSTDWHLIDNCPIPLLLTKSAGWGRSPVILAAIDPTSGNVESTRLDPIILETSSHIARLLDGELHVAHAYLPAAKVLAVGNTLANVAMAPVAPPAETESEERERQYAQVSEFVRRCGVRPQHLHVDMGDAASYLPRVASQEHADIVVMGAGPSGSAIPVLHDGIAARVLDGLPCDLLVLRCP